MKKINLLIIATSIVAQLSCSKTNAPLLDDYTLFEEQTRGEISQNDSTKGGGIGANKGNWIVVSDTVSATEVPYDDKSRNDSIPCDTVPEDSIPQDTKKYKNKKRVES